MKKNKIFALGFFDGVHRGHQVLLKECVRIAQENNCIPAAITFDNHPRSFYHPNPPKLISTNTDRIILLKSYGIQDVALLPVNDRFMSMHWRHFLEYMVQKGAAGFVCGDDFRFGYKGIGDTERLQQFCAERGMPCTIVQEQTLEGLRISSTHVRKLISEGNVTSAADFLGHPHLLSGIVVPGERLGRTIGIPTANFLVPEAVIVPKRGVYTCLCHLQGRTYAAVTNIGFRPTVNGHQERVETWILGFEGDLYGKGITLEMYEYLRPEKKFDSLQEMKAQILKDAGHARRLLQSRY